MPSPSPSPPASYRTLPINDSLPPDSSRLPLTTYAVFVGLVIALAAVEFGYHNGELNTPQEALTNCTESQVGTTLAYSPTTHTAPLEAWMTAPAITLLNSTSAALPSYTPALPPCLPMSNTAFSFATSIFTLGGLVGSFLAPVLADRLGRRRATMYNTIAYLTGSTAMGLATNLFWLLLGRFLVGVGAGVSIVVCPMYLTEIAPLQWRGSFGLMNQMGIVLGMLFTQTLGYFLNNVPGWRIVLGMGVVLGCLQLFLMTLCVESPKYLAAIPGGDIRARASLVRLRGTTDVDQELASWKQADADWQRVDTTASSAETESTVVSSTMDASLPPADCQESTTAHLLAADTASSPSSGASSVPSSGPLGFWAVIRSPRYRKPLGLALLLQGVQQWSGINTVFFYSTIILGDIFPGSAGLITVWLNVCNAAATVLSVYMVDRVGRRVILLSSMLGMAASLACLSLSLAAGWPLLSLVSVFAIIGTFAFGLGPLAFLLAVELVDTRAVAVVSSCGLAANWLSNFTVSTIFLGLHQLLGSAVFLVFTAILVGASGILFRQLPETKDKPIQEVWRAMGITE
ncbi:hypothetical protein H4R35_006687 [Dimargaris xerosporica]|nr:hypothetical protein H4R35_006687 [Dimargaris xerosporica]